MKLGDKEKKLIRLSKALGMPDAEIAEKVGCDKSTIWYYLNKNPLTIIEKKEPTKIDAELEEDVIKEDPDIEKTVDELYVEIKEPDKLEGVYVGAIKQQEVEILNLQNKVIELKAQCNEQEKMLKVMAVVNNLGNDILKIFRGEE